ncbi:unnamed protein product, partial [Amoebophrya sp. A25]|eukprot:GSA25T00012745001.1
MIGESHRGQVISVDRGRSSASALRSVGMKAEVKRGSATSNGTKAPAVVSGATNNATTEKVPAEVTAAA